MGAAGSKCKSAMQLLGGQPAHVTAEEPHLSLGEKEGTTMTGLSPERSEGTSVSNGEDQQSIEVTSETSVTLHWTRPDLGFIQVLSYIIEKKDPSDQDWVPVAVIDSGVTSYVIRDLDLRTNHWFRVLARSPVGLRSVLQSEGPIRIICGEIQADRPGPPTTPLLVVVTGPFSMDVKWGAPDSDGGCPVIGYVVALKESSRRLWVEVCQVKAPAVKAHIRDLQEGHEYLVRIYAWNDVGVSDPLETPEATKIIRPPGVVTSPSAPVGPLVVEEVTDSSVRLSWKPPEQDGGGGITNYLIEYRDVSASEVVKFSVRTPDDTTRFTVADLRSRHFYVFRICAENEAGTGDALVNKKPVRVQLTPVKPPAPQVPTVTVHPTMPDACIVTWAAPSPDVICYVVERCDLIADVWIMVGQEVDTTFVAENLVPGLEYSFRVSAENDAGMGKASPPSLPIVVTRKVSSMTAPEFINELSDCNALVDTDAKFDCEFVGIPTPEITWYKNGQEIFESRRIEIDTSNSTSTLLLRKVRLEDRGKIECQALNSAGLSTTCARLVVHAPPKIIASSSYKDGLMFDCGETVRIKLSYTGHPQPDLVWRHNGDVLTFEEGASTRQILDKDDQTVHLKIVDVDQRHRGTYSLVATNEHGRDEFSVDITVTGEPDPPEGKPRVISADWNSCTLSWDPPKNDGGSPISSYIVERQEVDTDLWLKATTAHHQECTVYGLMEGVRYYFRVRAVTVYGTSKPSESSDVVTIPTLSTGASAVTETSLVPKSDAESSEATEAIATEFSEETLVGSQAADLASTISEYGSDDQRSSLDVDEYVIEDIQGVDVESQASIPGAWSDLSDYDTLIPSSGVRYESIDVSELDYDKAVKDGVERQETMEEVDDQLELSHFVEEPEKSPDAERSVEAKIAAMEKAEKFALSTCQHSFDMVTDTTEDVADLALETYPVEVASSDLIPHDNLSVSTVVPYLCVAEFIAYQPSEHTVDITVTLNVGYLYISLCPVVLQHVNILPVQHRPAQVVRIITSAERDPRVELDTTIALLVMDVLHTLSVFNPPLRLSSTSGIADFQRPATVQCSVEVVPTKQLSRATVSRTLTEQPVYPISRASPESSTEEEIVQETGLARVKQATPVAINGHVRVREVKPSPEQTLQSSSGVETMTEFSATEEDIRALPESEQVMVEVKIRDVQEKNQMKATRRLIELSKRVERDYSAKRKRIERLEDSILKEITSLEQDLGLLRAIQRQLLRETHGEPADTLDQPSSGQRGRPSGSGRKARAPLTEGPRRIVYPPRRFYWSDSEDEGEPEMTAPRPRQLPKGQAPRFVSHLENRIIPCGHRIKLHCTVIADPSPDITWMKNGTKLPTSNRRIAAVNFDYGLCSLEIYNVKHEDTGEYLCLAVNPYGQATTCAYLRVAGYREPSPREPKFDSCPSDVTVNSNGTAVFVWKFSGFPAPAVKVLKDSKPLRTDLRREVLVSRDGTCRVTVQDVDSSDAGVYACIAENDSGTAVSTSLLLIAGQMDQKEEYGRQREQIEESHREAEREADEAVERAREIKTCPLPPMSRAGDYYEPRRHFRTFGRRGLDALEDIPRTRQEPYRVPGPPLDPVVTERGRTWATLTWTRPIDDGGEPITAYRVQFRETPSKTWREKGLSRICLFDVYGLKPNTDYVFQVSAKNKHGWSPGVVAVPELANWSF